MNSNVAYCLYSMTRVCLFNYSQYNPGTHIRSAQRVLLNSKKGTFLMNDHFKKIKPHPAVLAWGVPVRIVELNGYISLDLQDTTFNTER